VPSGSGGRSTFYSLTSDGKNFLEEHGDAVTSIRKTRKFRYFFNFGSLGLVELTIESLHSNEGICMDTIEELVVSHILYEQMYHRGSPKIDSKITIKISAKKVDKDIFRGIVYPLYEESKRKEPIISNIEECVRNGGEKIRKWISWHLTNVCDVPYEILEEQYPDRLFLWKDNVGYPIDLETEQVWFKIFGPLWEKLGLNTNSPRYKYWGTLIFVPLYAIDREDFRFALHRVVRDNDLAYLSDFMEDHERVDDLTFLMLWDDIRDELLGPLPQDLRYVEGLAHLRKKVVKEFPPFVKLIDKEIYKKWVIRGKPKIKGTYDIPKFLRIVMGNAWNECFLNWRIGFPAHLKSARLRRVLMRRAGELALDYMKRNRFDIVETSVA
jgi:hypothetical protein